MAIISLNAVLCQPALLGRQQGVDSGLLRHHHQSKAANLSNFGRKSRSSSSFSLSSSASTVSVGQRIVEPSLRYTDLNKRRQQQEHRMKDVVVCSSNICWQDTRVSKEQRSRLLRQKGCIVWLTGLSGSGKTTVAFNVDSILTSMGKACYVLDGDNLRHGLCNNLGFSAADRAENMRRVGETARLFVDAGLITLVSLISPYRRDRDNVRDLVRNGEFIEVYMNVPLEICERRDCKGLYKLARAGVITGFTGIDDPYEAPSSPEIILKDSDGRGGAISAEEMARIIVNYLSDNGYLLGCS